MAAPKLPFREIADAALRRAEELVPRWLPDGHRVVAEWKATNPRRVDNHVGSFSVNLHKGIWADFACDDKGADLVSLYAYLFCNDDQGHAAHELAESLGVAMPEPAKRVKRASKAATESVSATDVGEPASVAAKKARTEWVPVLPVPTDAPEPPRAHEFRGVPARSWRYLDAGGALLGLVCRFDKSDGGKEIIPLTFCEHAESHARAWRWLSFADPRPLYGLDRLAAKPDATVLVVEGEKCADAGDAELPELAVVTWSGGAGAVDKSDVLPLAARKIVLWADCDAQRERLSRAEKDAGVTALDKPMLPASKQPGVKTMAKLAERLHALGCRVWIVDIPAPGEKPGGWDIADAIAEGLAGEALAAWIRDHARAYGGETATDATRASREDGEEGGPLPNASEWRRRLVEKRGEWVPCVANAYEVLANHRAWDGVLAWDEHSSRAVKLKPPPYLGGALGEWDSIDDSMTAMWLTQHERLVVTSGIVAEAVEALARRHSVHPPRDWLRGLPSWDGIPRLRTWLTDLLGVPLQPDATDAGKHYNGYVARVGTWYLMGMVARVMRPGCKFDYCMVLEGIQGKGKSTALSILGGAWYGDTDLDLHNKDAMSALRGKWLYEFSEMGSVTRAESSKQKSFLSRQIDEFRPVYGRREIKCMRQLVFAGSVNDWEWQKDPTGGRRFWPVECQGKINLDGLRVARDQLFAEALAMYDEGKRYWPTETEQKLLFDPQQLARESPDGLLDALHDWVYGRVTDFSLSDAVMDGLKLDASKLTRDLQTRVGIVLRKLGCARVEKRNGITRYWYKPPVKERPAKSSYGDAVDHEPAQAVSSMLYGGDDVGF